MTVDEQKVNYIISEEMALQPENYARAVQAFAAALHAARLDGLREAARAVCYDCNEGDPTYEIFSYTNTCYWHKSVDKTGRRLREPCRSGAIHALIEKEQPHLHPPAGAV